MKGANKDITANRSGQFRQFRQSRQSTKLPSSTMELDCADQEAETRKEALFPGRKVTCIISHRAYYRVVDFKRRGGPEPDWYYFKGWSHELGEFESPERETTPEEAAREQAATEQYFTRWNASLDRRHAVLLHAVCAAVETRETVEKAPHDCVRGLPNGCAGYAGYAGYVPFTVPADLSSREPPIELVVWCEENPNEEVPDQVLEEVEAGCSVFVVVAGSEEAGGGSDGSDGDAPLALAYKDDKNYEDEDEK